MAKKRVNVWLSEENIQAATIISGVARSEGTPVSRSQVFNTLISEGIRNINKQIDEGNDDWKRKQWH